QQTELIFAVVNESAARIEVGGGYLPCNMKHRPAAVPRLDDRSSSVACSRARTRQCNSQLSGNARKRIGHVDDRRFVPRRNHTKTAVSLQRIVNRKVVNAD